MTVMDKFDVVRHLFEFIFYLVTGPLVTIFAFKKLRQSRNKKYQMLSLQKRLLELSQNDKIAFKEKIVPLIENLDSESKKENTNLLDKR